VVFLTESESVQVLNRLFINALPLEIQLSRGEGWDPVNQFNPVSLSQAMILELKCNVFIFNYEFHQYQQKCIHITS
jgi:hypothetical protein